jgi:hypothetical protein
LSWRKTSLFLVLLHIIFLDHTRAGIPEQTYLRISQPYYLSGETLHYAVYLFSPVPGNPAPQSKILVTELSDQQGNLITRHFHRMTGTTSQGSISLPDTLETGCYWLRAYTRYQIGYTENLIHYLPVFVVNPDDLDQMEILKKKLDFSSEEGDHRLKPPPGPEDQSSPDDVSVQISGMENPYYPGDQVNLKIRINAKLAGPGTRYSLTVRSSVQFSSEIIIPQYFSRKGSHLDYRIGTKLPAQKTEGIVQAMAGDPVYDPQQEMILRGKLIDPESKENLAFRAVALTQTGKHPGFKLLFTDREGNFEFSDLNFINRDNFLVLNAGDINGIILENLAMPAFSPPGISGNLTGEKFFLEYVEKRKLDRRYKKFYTLQSVNIPGDTGEEDYSTLRIYEKADRIYKMDDYIALRDMREVIIELLPNVKIYRENDRSRIRIYSHQNSGMSPDPLFLVNGRIVKDNDFILNFDNRNVDRIEVLVKKSSLAPFGPMGIGGVVAIYTHKPVAVPSGLELDIEGYHEPQDRVIQVNPAGSEQQNMPDFNPLIYWDPGCRTDEKGLGEVSFLTNELTGEFEIILEGITAEGFPFYTRELLSVKRQDNP